VARVELGPEALADLDALSALIESDGGPARADAYLAIVDRRTQDRVIVLRVLYAGRQPGSATAG
jgi:plasmid stabilization system protein ParE